MDQSCVDGLIFSFNVVNLIKQSNVLFFKLAFNFRIQDALASFPCFLVDVSLMIISF